MGSLAMLLLIGHWHASCKAFGKPSQRREGHPRWFGQRRPIEFRAQRADPIAAPFLFSPEVSNASRFQGGFDER